MQQGLANGEGSHETSKSNVLLTELVIVILFFALTAATVMQLFVAAHQKSQLNARITEASIIAQDMAEMLAQEPKPEDVLLESGYTKRADNEYYCEMGENRSVVKVATEQTPGGEIIFSTIELYNSAAERAQVALMLSKGISQAEKAVEPLVTITAATYVQDISLGNQPAVNPEIAEVKTPMESPEGEEVPIEAPEEGVSA